MDRRRRSRSRDAGRSLLGPPSEARALALASRGLGRRICRRLWVCLGRCGCGAWRCSCGALPTASGWLLGPRELLCGPDDELPLLVEEPGPMELLHGDARRNRERVARPELLALIGPATADHERIADVEHRYREPLHLLPPRVLATSREAARPPRADQARRTP